MEDLKLLLSAIGTLTGITSIILVILWQAYSKRKDQEEKQKVLDGAINMLRERADKSLQEHCDKTEKIYEAMSSNIAEIKTKLAVIETRNELTNSYMEKMIAPLLKSPTHYEKDALLTHMEEGNLSLQEAEKLREILLHEKDEPENKNKLSQYILGIMSLTNRINIMRMKYNDSGKTIID